MSTEHSRPLDVHDEAALRLARLEQRYTTGRRAIVTVLASAGRPLPVPEIVAAADRAALPSSSAYRNLTVLADAGVVHRVAGADDYVRYELAEEIAGHHHHLLCATCGVVVDVATTPRLERALAEAARAAAAESGFDVTGHRMELVGHCADCR